MFGDNKIICPYCYGKHDIKDFVYECSYNADGVFKNSDGTDKECEYGFQKSNGRIARENVGKCLKCTSGSNLFRYCPEYYNQKTQEKMPIPINVSFKDPFPIALIGARASGKSNYIAVLVNEILKKMPQMGCSYGYTEDTRKNYQKLYYKPLYERNRAVDSTDKGKSNPLLYWLNFGSQKTVPLTLYDTAGENFNDEQSMLYNNQYISNARGIILLLDPLQLPFVRERLKGTGVVLPTLNTDTIDILNRVVNLTQNQKRTKGKIDIPVAMVFTKTDVLAKYNILPEESCLRTQSEHIARGGFVKSDFNETSIEMQALLENFETEHIEGVLKNFSNYAFFGVSSFGEEPDKMNTLTGAPHPIRVLDPLLWLLSKNKYIKTI